MDRSAYALHASVEEHHWWFCARRRVVEALLRSLSLPHGSTLLELGSGTGGNLPLLLAYGEVWAVEPDDEARQIARAKAPSARHLSSIAELPGGARLDAAVMLDVLEHLDRPGDDLARLAERLAPGAPVVVTVPAHPALFGEHDRYLHHRRRYTRPMLRAHLEEGGLVVERLGAMNAVSLVPAAIARALEAARGPRPGARGMGVPPALLNRALEAAFAAERHLLPRASMPFGLSLFAIARRPPAERQGR